MPHSDVYHKLTVELPFKDQDQLEQFRQAGADYNAHHGERRNDVAAFVEMVIDYERQRKDLAEQRKEYSMLLQSYNDLAGRYARLVEQMRTSLEATTSQIPKARRA